MHTAHAMTISPSMFCARGGLLLGVPALAGVCLLMGGCLLWGVACSWGVPAPGGWYLSMH